MKTVYGIIGIVCVAILGWFLFNRKNETRSEEPSPQHKRDVAVRVVQPRKGVLQRLCIQPGSVQAYESVPLFSQVEGQLKFQDVDINARVTEGSVLALVDVPDIEAQLDRTVAGMQKAQAQVTQMQAHLDVAQANLIAAKSDEDYANTMFKRAKAWTKYRKQQEERIDKLVKEGAIQEQLHDESVLYLDAAFEAQKAAEVKIATAKEHVKASNARIKGAKADIVSAEAEVKVAEAEFHKAAVKLNFAFITAPFDGVVTQRGFYPGALIKAQKSGSDDTPIFTVDRTDLFRVVVQVPDRDVEFIKVGEKATLHIDSLPGRAFKAKVSRMADFLDPKTRLMRVELDLPQNDNQEIKGGMYGQVTIELKKNEELLSIPTVCLMDHNEKTHKAYVYVVRDGKAVKIPVKTGMDTGIRVIVREGLAADDHVILDPSSEFEEHPEVTATLFDDSATLKTDEE